MQAFYRRLKTLIRVQIFWSLDYMYVFRRQIFGAINRTSASRYRNPHTSQPSVILIPGIYENWQFMKPVADVLHNYDYDVHVIEGLGYNRRGVEDMANVVNTYIETSDMKAFVLIAHSKGGLIGKYLLANHNTNKKIKGLIALNAPFSGSRYAYLFLLFRSLRIFVPNSPILKLLAKNHSVNHSIVSIYGKFDPHIPGGSRLDGAKNIQLDTHGHFRIMNDRAVHQTILNELRHFEKG